MTGNIKPQQVEEQEYIIDPEFRNLLPKKTSEQNEELKEMILREGIREPLVVWDEENILLDGHNRHEICLELNIKPPIKTLSFANRSEAKMWIVRTQSARRNMNTFQRVELALKFKDDFAVKAKANQRAAGGAVPQKSVEPVEVVKEVAKMATVSHDTVRKVEKILAKANAPEVAKAIDALNRGATSISKVFLQHCATKESDSGSTREAVRGGTGKFTAATSSTLDASKEKALAAQKSKTPGQRSHCRGKKSDEQAPADSDLSEWVQAVKEAWWRIPSARLYPRSSNGDRTTPLDAMQNAIDNIQRAKDKDILGSLLADLQRIQTLALAGGTELTREKTRTFSETRNAFEFATIKKIQDVANILERWFGIQSGFFNCTPFEGIPSYQQGKLNEKDVIKAITYVLLSGGWKAKRITKTLITITGMDTAPGGVPMSEQVRDHAISYAKTKRTVKGFREVRQWLRRHIGIDIPERALCRK